MRAKSVTASLNLPRRATRLLIALILGVVPIASPVAMVAHAAPCDAPIANPIACENTKPGNPSSQWDISGAGDSTIQGFATDISYNKGDTVHFRISTPASAYTITVYRMGYYQGNGARQITTVNPSVALPQTQPACFTDNSVGLTDCGNWADSATWTIPTDAVSGVYFARLRRNDTGGASHIVFIVRDDTSTSDVVFETDDPTWQAYNQYGGSSTYQSNLPQGRAYKVSYNRPFATRGQDSGYGTANWVFYGEYPMIRWLEMNGYNVSYMSGLDGDRNGALIKNHKVFLSAGHDEYWSAGQRANVEAARDAGVNLAFFSGNLSFWKTRWEDSKAGPDVPNRTLVVYKETKEAQPIDPQDPPTWTGTWRDPTWSPPADGGRPENAFLGTIFQVNRGSSNIVVPSADKGLRIWRNTAVANLANGASLTLGNPSGGSVVLGYEWDTDVDNGFRPAGLIRLSQTTVSVPELIQDYGNTFAAGTATHYMTQYRAPSGALVFSAGTVEWSWGLDVNHDTNPDIGPSTPDPNMQQMTVNILADMGAQPSTLQAGMVAAAKTTDTTPPTATITSPANGSSAAVNSNVTISGTSSDAGGGVVAGVEVSTDAGSTWHPASGTTSWSYTWTPKWGGPANVKVRAADDSSNLQTPGSGITINVTGDTTPPTISSISASNITGTNATVKWNTNEPATSQVQYGLTTSYGSTTTVDNTLVFNHSQVLSGLSPSTTYHFRIISKDTVGNQATSADNTLTTPAAGTVALAGDQGIEGLIDQDGAGSAEAFQYLASTTGTANVMYLYIDGANQASKVTVGLYNNSSSNDPGTLLSQATITSPVNGAWNSVTIPNATVTAGFKYWIAILSPSGTGTLFFRDTSNGTRTVSSSQANLTSLPSTFSVGPTYSNTPLSAYVGQVGGSIDSTPPTVSITAPTNGATVSGSGVTISANASDNVAVANVQFMLDGQTLGAPLTGSPYSTTWDSTTVVNGTHTIGARATDTSGNVGTAGTVSVTVSNVSAPPVISTVLAGTPTSSAATITWTTDKSATSQVNYGTTAAYGSSTTDPTLVTSHSLTLTGLAASTTYHYQVVSVDAQNNSTNSGDFTFITAPDTTPPAISNVNSGGLSNTGATITWSTDKASDSQVDYGTTTSYGSSTALNTTLVTSHSAALSGLQASTTYHYRVKSRDAAGNLATSNDFTFTTLATCPCTIWSTSSTPTTAAANDNGAVEVGVKFRSDATGYIYGIRFYKSATNTGTHVGNLWTSTGTLLASGTFVNEAPSGWQQLQFSTPVQIQANTTYVASYHTNTGNYAADANFFATSVDKAPLHALANGVDGGNGVYVYSANSAFPNQTFNSTNYWIDTIFDTTSNDVIPPFITNVQSSAGTSTSAITWNTNSATDSQVDYGTTTAYGTSTPLQSALVTSHSVSLTGLASSTTYHYRVRSSGAVSGDFTFTTTGTPTCPCTIWPSSAAPSNAAANDGQSIEVGVKFRSDVAGYIMGVRFYKASTNTGTHVGSLWTSTGTQLASATFTSETTSGWQQVTFSAPVQIQANTTYVASYHSNSVYAADGGYFASNGTDSGYLHALANGTDGPDGVYIYAATSTFPTQTFNSTNYWVDLVFNTTAVDTTPPNISGVQASGIGSTSATITWTTDENSTSQVDYGASASYGSSSTINTNLVTSHSVALSGLTAGTLYHYRVKSQDASGNLATSADFTFTTGSGSVACPCSIWSATAAPKTAAANDTNSVELGVKFRSDVGGLITGIRFYKGSTNTGTHVGSLWSSTGTLLAQATFTAETASGWQTVTFATPVAIQANTTYVASYHTNVGHYAADKNFFNSTGVDNAPLHALSNAAAGGNGVFIYSTPSAFPTQSSNATNYWVDVVLTTN